MLGALLSLISAASFAMNATAVRRGVLSGSVLQAMAITVPMGVPLFALAVALWGAWGALVSLPLPALGWLSLAGVLHFVLGRYGNYRATRALGSNLGGLVQQASVVVAVLLAVVLLDERLSPLKLAGIGLVIVGPAIMAMGRHKPAASGFVPKYGEGYLWGGVSALVYGISPLMVRQALSEGGVGAALAGGLVSYIAAALAVAVIVVLPGNVAHIRTVRRSPGWWFAASGFFVFVSQLFRYAALALAPVTVVAPIQRLSVVFRVIFGWMVNREHEVFGARLVIGIAVSFAGAALLAAGI